jgi:hypothetical protein
MVEGLLPSDLVAKYEAPRFSRRISIGNFQYLATAANAFDHVIKRRVLAIDWIIWIIRQVLPRALDRPALGGGRPVPPCVYRKPYPDFSRNRIG